MKPAHSLILCLIALLWAIPHAGADGADASGTLLTFDADSPRLTLCGDARRSRGLQGRALVLNGAGHAEFELQRPLRSAEGTLMLWLQPTWAAGDTSSHALISFGWEDGRDGYAVLSQGFHERKRGRRLTFILNHKDILCVSERQLEPGKWHFLTLVWSGGRWGFCKLFVDGVKLAQRVKRFQAGYLSKSTLYLGTDFGTANRQGREARACIDQVRIIDRALTEGAVKNGLPRGLHGRGHGTRTARPLDGRGPGGPRADAGPSVPGPLHGGPHPARPGHPVGPIAGGHKDP